jgi:hypothetical protein
MTQVWGPLGWMTLHSISTIYPDNPTEDDKTILKRFMKSFEDTISCPSCKGHFIDMSNVYKSRVPTWLNSRIDFFTFICIAHNTVNKRLDKPRPKTLLESFETFKNNTVHTSAAEFRQKYIQYLNRNWTKEMSGDSMIMMARVKEMKAINDSYWTPRDSNLESFVIQDTPVDTLTGTPAGTPAQVDVLTPIPQSNERTRVGPNNPNYATLPNVRIGLRGGRLRLIR